MGRGNCVPVLIFPLEFHIIYPNHPLVEERENLPGTLSGSSLRPRAQDEGRAPGGCRMGIAQGPARRGKERGRTMERNEQTQREETPREPRKRRSRKKRVLLTCCLTAAVLVGAYGILCGVGSRGLIYPNVTINGVELGGLTQDQAQQTLDQALQEQPPDDSRGVLFRVTTAQGEEMPVSVPLSSVVTDLSASIGRAWQVGNELPFPARGGWYLRCLFQDTPVLPAYENGQSLEDILDQIEANLCREPVEPTWEAGETELTMTKGQPGYALDREVVKEEVFAYLGRDEMVTLDQAKPQFTVALTENLPPELDLDTILGQVERPVRDAKFDQASKVFQTDRTGLSFDPAKARAAFADLDWGKTTEFPLEVTQPQVTVQDLTPKLYQDVLGSCTTNIAGTANRVGNIRLAAQLFNGTTLMPGEIFSYNGSVGRRTAARGFLPAPAYVGGETVQETGGGVCQGSSTLYLATLRANLEIVERYPHGYITRYVPDGMDATVYYGAKDFRFKNNTPFPVKLMASVSGRSLTVNVLGTKSDNIKVEMTSKVVGTTGYQTVYKVDASLPAGSTRVSVTPYTGYTVKVYRNLYENGSLKDTKLENTSVYRSRDKVVLVSPADAAQYGL